MKMQRDVGEGYYVTYRSVYGSMGANHPVNIAINRHDDYWYYYEVTDKLGNFNNFPGIKSGSWEKKLEIKYYEAVQFNFFMSDFADGKSVVKWILQPDGRFYEDDDGFGGEDFEEIALYSIMDARGNFLVPFTDREIEAENWKWLY